MPVNSFSIQEALQFGFNRVKARLKFFLLLMIVPFAIQMVFRFLGSGASGIASAISKGSSQFQLSSIPFFILAILFPLIGGVLNIIMAIGNTKIYLDEVVEKDGELSDLFHARGLFWKYLGASIVTGFLSMIGFFLLIIPGIFFTIIFQFFAFCVVENQAGPIEALKQSAALTKGVRIKLFLFGLVSLGVNLVGLLCLGIGLFITIPTTLLAHVYVYRKLNASSFAAPSRIAAATIVVPPAPQIAV